MITALLIAVAAFLGLAALDEDQFRRAARRTSYAAGFPEPVLSVLEVDVPDAGLIPNGMGVTTGMLNLVESEGEIAGAFSRVIGHGFGFLGPIKQMVFTRKDLLLVVIVNMTFLPRGPESIFVFGAFMTLAMAVMMAGMIVCLRRESGKCLGAIGRLAEGTNVLMASMGAWPFAVIVLAISRGVTPYTLVLLVLKYLATVLYLGWSLREMEHSADLKGIKLMRKAEYNPREYLRLLEKLPDLTHHNWWMHCIFDWLPRSSERIKRLDKVITGWETQKYKPTA